MKLKFLGKRKSNCSKCGGMYKFETRVRYSIPSPFGIQIFMRGQIYEFNEEEFNYWKEAGYRVGHQFFNYFRVV